MGKTLDSTEMWRKLASYGLGALYAGLTGIAIGWFATLGAINGITAVFG